MFAFAEGPALHSRSHPGDQDDIVMRQVSGCFGLAARRKIGGAGADDAADMAHEDRAHGGIGKVRNAQAQIDAFIHE